MLQAYNTVQEQTVPVTTINDITDLVRVLQDHPEWKNTVRGLIIGEELAQLPQRVTRLEQTLADFIEATNRNFETVHARLDSIDARMDHMDARFDAIDVRLDRMDARFDAIDVRLDRMDARFDGMDTRMDRMDGRMDNGFGMNYELKVGKNVHSIAGQHLGIRRVRLLRGNHDGVNEAFADSVEDALDEGKIDRRQANELLSSDLIFAGRNEDTGEQVYVAAELSITIGGDDITRAADRASILRSIVDRPVIPAVIGASIDDARVELASAQRVSVAISPE